MTTAKCKLSILVQTHHHFISKPLMFAKATVRCVQKRSEALRGERARAPLACWWCESEQGIALAPPHSRAPDTTRRHQLPLESESWDGGVGFPSPARSGFPFIARRHPQSSEAEAARTPILRDQDGRPGRRAGATVVGLGPASPANTDSSPFHTGASCIFYGGVYIKRECIFLPEQAQLSFKIPTKIERMW